MSDTHEVKKPQIQEVISKLKDSIPQIIGFVIGGLAGFIYYYKVGCASGTCSIKSNPWLMTLWGAIMGYLIIDIFSPLLNKLNAMKNNMGTIDKVIRILVAVVIAVLFFTKVITGVLGIVLLALAIIFVLTSLISFCPLYLFFGLNTGKKKE
jgi:small-conductance mechanosensitive channel